MKGKKLYVLGAGGHSKVVISTIEDSGYAVSGIYDDKLPTTAIHCGKNILGTISDLKNSEEVCDGIIAIGSNSLRKILSAQISNVNWRTFIHPTAYVHPSVKLGLGVVVMAGAIIQPDSVIGDHAIINTGALIDHDCNIGNFVHIAPGCKLAGGVIVQEETFLGIGTAVIHSIRIGSKCLVGAGSVVVEDIATNLKVFGVPAKVRGVYE
jgi:sugar O-acyltransferase (sialic acid O-acetyltransferase NeuD family)